MIIPITYSAHTAPGTVKSVKAILESDRSKPLGNIVRTKEMKTKNPKLTLNDPRVLYRSAQMIKDSATYLQLAQQVY